MRILLNVTSTNEYASDGCDAAYLDLTPELAQVALRRIDLFKAMQQADPQAYEAYFWDYSAVYFDPYAEDGDRWERYTDTEGNEFTELDESAPTPLESEIGRTECGQMAVTEDEIKFTAIPKNGNHYITTGSIGIRTLREAAAVNVSA